MENINKLFKKIYNDIEAKESILEPRKPGRPRKPDAEPEMELVPAAMPDYTHVALGIYQDETDRQWYVATFKFDPKTGGSVMTERTLAGEDKYFASELFKIRTVELEML